MLVIYTELTMVWGVRKTEYVPEMLITNLSHEHMKINLEKPLISGDC